MMYFLKVRVDHQRLTPNELWGLWEQEAVVALKAKAEGRIVALSKVVGQPRMLIVIDVESHDEIDQALMAVMRWHMRRSWKKSFQCASTKVSPKM